MNIVKKLNIMLAIILICFAVCLLTILFYKPYQRHNNDLEINKALEEQRIATKEQISARQNMVEQAGKMVDYLKQRDSVLNLSLQSNSEELKKIRDGKKDVDYSNYDSKQLQRAVADAARQYRAARQGH